MNKKVTYFFSIIILLGLTMALVSCSKQNQTLTNFYEDLNIPLEVTNDLNLKNEYEFEGNKILVTWTSTNEKLVSTTGVVKRGLKDQDVILIAEANLNGEIMKKTYVISVKGDNTISILESVAKKLMVQSPLSQNISLPQTKNYEGTDIIINWSSDHPELITNTGEVNLPNENTNVILKATLFANGITYEREFPIVITKDPDFSIGNVYATKNVFLGEIEGEAYPEKLKEFNGALYRKVSSSRDEWLGIEVLVTLPEFIGDEGRTGLTPWGPQGVGNMRYLDNASVYLGGNCLKESDVGLSLSVGALPDKSDVDYSKQVFYRPFWRFITSDNRNVYVNAPWQQVEYYYYPGDTVRMSVYISSKNSMQLRVELVTETTIPKYKAMRDAFNLGDNYNKVFVSPEFESSGSGVYNTTFKRVCALDQVNNEGKATQPTNAKSVNTIWHEVYLYRNIDGEIMKVPMVQRRAAYISSPSSTNALGDFTNAFKISYENVDPKLGGEVVTIDSNNRK